MHNFLVRDSNAVHITLGKKISFKTDGGKKGIQFNFVQFEETRKTFAVGHTATNDWRPLHLGTFLLLQIPIDHTEAIFTPRNFLARKGKTIHIPFGTFRKYPLKQLQKEGIPPET